MAKGGRLYELAFRIGGQLNRSFVSSTSAAGKQLTALQQRSAALARQQRLKKALGEVGGHLRTIGRTAAIAGAALGAMAVGAGYALYRLTSQTAALGDRAIKTAQQLGVGVETLQELWYAAERSGAAQGDLDTALRRMSVSIGQAAAGTGEARQWLDRLGVSVEELQRLAPEEQMGRLADGLRTIPSQAERAAASQALFGRGAMKLGVLLDEGSEGMARLREEARATGGVLSEAAAKDAARFQDRMLDLKLTLAGLKTTIGTALMPVLTRLFERLAGWLRGNRELVVRFAERLKELAAGAIGRLVDAVQKWIDKDMERHLEAASKAGRKLWGWLVKGADAAVWFVDVLGGLEPALRKVAIAVAAIYAIKLAVWAYEVGAALWSLNAALLANPAALLAVLLAAQVVAIILAIKYWDQLRDRFLALPAWAKAAGIGLAWLTVPLWIVPAAIVAIVRNLDELGAAFDWLTDRVADGIALIVKWADVIVPALLLGPFGLIAGLIAHYWDEITGALGHLTDWMVEAGAGLLRALASGISSGAGVAIDAVANVAGQIRALLPFSDASTGPLAHITASGAALVHTMGAGVEQAGAGPITRPLSESLAQVTPTAAAAGGRGGSMISLSFAPQITVQASGDAKAQVMAALRSGADDLLDRLREAQDQERRLAYG